MNNRNQLEAWTGVYDPRTYAYVCVFVCLCVFINFI